MDVTAEGYARARNNLRQFHRVTARGGLRVAYNEFPPFVRIRASREPSGPFFEMFHEVAADLGTTVTAKWCEWSDFAEGLARREFLTVAAPILPVHVRAVNIVAVVWLRCGALFFNRRLGEPAAAQLERQTHKIYQALMFGRGDVDGERHAIETIEAAIGAMAQIGREGFAVGRVYFEQFLLQRLNAPIAKELPGRLLVEEAQAEADDGHLCVIDVTTLREIEDRVGTAAFERRYRFMPLLGEYLTLPAGLPFLDEDLGTYLLYEWRNKSESPIRRAVRGLENEGGNGHATPVGFAAVDAGNQATVGVLPDILTTRDARFYREIAGMLESGVRPAAGGLGGAWDAGHGGMEAGGTARGLLPMAAGHRADLAAIMDALREPGRAGVGEALRQVIYEEGTARRYVVQRYRELVNKKHLDGLSDSEESEVAALTGALDEMDEPFYEKIIGRLRALARAGEGSN